MKLKKIAMAVRSLRGKTGASNIILGHIRQLTNLGFEVHVYSEKIISGIVKENGGIPHRLFRLPAGKFLSRLLYAKRVQRLVNRGKFDLVIGHGDIVNQDVLFMHNLVRQHIELLGGDSEKSLAAPAKIHDRVLKAQSFSLCIANSKLMRSALIQQHHVPEEKIQVVYPGYPKEQFSLDQQETLRGNFRRRYIPDDKVAIGFVTSGAFELRGFDILIKTLSMLEPPILSKITVIVVGDSRKVEKYLQKLSVSYSIKNIIQPIEKTENIETVYHGLDILFYPSRLDTFGLVVEEAAVCGIPVLTSHQVGASELFIDEARELLVATPAPDAFIKKLHRLIDAPMDRQRLGEAMRQSFIHNTQDYYFEKITNLLF